MSQLTKNQVMSVLNDCKESARIINQDVDGEVSCPRALHQIACINRAIEIVHGPKKRRKPKKPEIVYGPPPASLVKQNRKDKK